MLIKSIKRGASLNLNTAKVQKKSNNLFRYTRAASMSLKTGSSPMNKPAAVQDVYTDQMYQQWRQNSASVDESWNKYFSGGQEAPSSTSANASSDVQAILDAIKSKAGAGASQKDLSKSQSDGFKLFTLIRAYMSHGHLRADLDPLNLQKLYEESISEHYNPQLSQYHDLLDFKHYGFSEQDLDRTYEVSLPYHTGLLEQRKNWTLRELIAALENAYCGKVGIEYMHIPSRTQSNWIREKCELRQYETMTQQEKLVLLDRIYWTDEFSQFIGVKFNTMKRFGLEGCESFIPGMKAMIDVLAETGCQKTVIGMPHRGRLNMLANVVRKPLETIFAEFQGVVPDSTDSQISSAHGDVKYHLGCNYTRSYPNGAKMNVEVLANPSHLECVNPVVMGRCRAENHQRSTREENLIGRNKVVPILIHGDAAFSGQGVCYESLQMQDLPNYTVGGTIHVIVNNQIGFTTVPQKGRSGMYASDLAKTINAPIFHVNADSLEDVHWTFKIAAQYRQEFNHDVVIDLIGYRKMGHNELDQPSFTQPLMYKQVSKMTPVARIYEAELLKNGTTNPEQIARMKKKIVIQMEEAYSKSKDHHFKSQDWANSEWEAIKQCDQTEGKLSGVPLEQVKNIGLQISNLPKELVFHRLVRKIFEQRHQNITNGSNIDWGTAEALAFATLIDEGYHVRLSGQDVERGTFSHRHAHVWYQDQDGYYNPINECVQKEGLQRKFIASNSHLSEFAVLGYELGYAQTNPNTLTLWEAQFGDFANGAQVIIDQFLVSGETKWNVQNGLVMLLPHGYDGQGPEHSSCRTERYLILADQDEFVPKDLNYDNTDISSQINMKVAHPTTAANYFHLLRTHMRMPFRKPLIVVAPKKLLRYKGATSNIEDFTTGTRFEYIIKDQNPNQVEKSKVRKVIFCSGQVYFDIEEARAKEGKNDIAIVRIESLCPFPFKEVIAEMKNYPKASVTWAQEEPKNAGSYSYVHNRLRNCQKHLGKKANVEYVGRPIMAASAVGFTKTHVDQLNNLINSAMA